MEMDPNVLLALIAVRLLGGQAAPAASESLKALKKFVKDATDRGWLKEDTVTETVPVEGGKPKTKKVAVIALTEAGEQVLRQAASAEVLAATQASHLQALRQRLEADHASLKAEVTASLAGAAKAGKDEDKVARELAKVSQAVQDLVGKVTKLDALQPKGGHESVLAALEAGFTGLKDKVEHALKGVASVVVPALAPRPAAPAAPAASAAPSAPAAPAPAPAAPAAPAAPPAPPPAAAPAKAAEQHTAPPRPPEPRHAAPAPAAKPAEKHPAPAAEAPRAEEKHPAPAAPTGNTVIDVLHRAYDQLKQQPKYQDANVDLPSLYRQAQREKAELSVDDFHKSLLELEEKRAVTLSFHTESKGVPDADKGIQRHGKLIYTVYWFRD